MADNVERELGRISGTLNGVAEDVREVKTVQAEQARDVAKVKIELVVLSQKLTTLNKGNRRFTSLVSAVVSGLVCGAGLTLNKVFGGGSE